MNQEISKYIFIATAKLRKYNQLSSAITVFTTTNIHSKDFFRSEASAKLNIPTSNTIIIYKQSLVLIKKIFKPYRKFIKAGVILHKLQSNKYKQNLLFREEYIKEEFHLERLNSLIDNMNKRSKRDLFGWGSSAIKKDWRTPRKKLSYLKTTTIESIPSVFAK